MKKHSFLNLVVISFLTVAIVSQISLAYAGTATLTWNANTEPDLAGYKVYYGTSSRTGTDPKVCGNCGYSTFVNVGNVTSYIFNNLTDGQTYYFSVSAYDTSNNESVFSNQVSKVISSVASVSNVTFSTAIEGQTIASSKNFSIRILTAGTTNLVGQVSATTNTSGVLVFPSISVPAGIYDIIASSTSYLAKKITNVNLTSNATITLPKLLAGNLYNNDNTINSLDWQLMSSVWFTSDSANNGRADINGDGIVNTFDFSFMSKNWGQVGD